jgi:hypothetical protein
MCLKKTVLAAALMLAPLCANASVMMYIERVSDTVATITGTGNLNDVRNRLRFYELTTTGDSGGDPITGALTLGGIGVATASTKSGTTDFYINLVGDAAAGSGFSGSLTVTLDAETWAPVGTTGSMGNGEGHWSVVSSQISAVPLPAGLPLLLAGLGGLGLIRKRQTA